MNFSPKNKLNDVPFPKDPLDLDRAGLVIYSFDLLTNEFEEYYSFDQFYNMLFINYNVDGKIFLSSIGNRIKIKYKIVNKKTFKIKLAEQRLFDYKNQWEFYRLKLASCYQPHILLENDIIHYSESSKAWDVYDEYN